MSLKLLRRAAGRAHAEEVSAPQLLATVTGIDATSTGSTTLYTVPAATTIVVLEVVLRCTASDVTSPATGGVGIAAGEDDIFASQQFYGLIAADEQFTFPSGGISRTAKATEAIKLGIDTGASGGTPTQTLAADIYGYEV